MTRLLRLNTTELSTWVQTAKSQVHKGRVVERIPLLAGVDPHLFAVYICCESGEIFSAGDTACHFSLMSTIKPLSLLYLLEHLGADKVSSWVGMEPSDLPFNSLKQLIADKGRPRNAMINSGAITIADKLPGKDASDRTVQFCHWLNQIAGCQLTLDEMMLASVRSAASEINLAITQYLAQAGYVNNPDIALDTYEQICCLSGTVMDLARLGILLACEQGLIKPQHRQIVTDVMLKNGLYEASGQLSLQIGLPMKSGISGTLLALVPGEGAIACYSPPLDIVGNPVAALAFVESLSQKL
ncbi:MAG: glutaminase [Nostocaceae cyanobacterium]|nr:glutaminase [Nostocaceae cyanobacterium]